ncbi:hypothetical protein JCM11641_004932 [Rhodosporidiobolus odoratus]
MPSSARSAIDPSHLSLLSSVASILPPKLPSPNSSQTAVGPVDQHQPSKEAHHTIHNSTHNTQVDPQLLGEGHNRNFGLAGGAGPSTGEGSSRPAQYGHAAQEAEEDDSEDDDSASEEEDEDGQDLPSPPSSPTAQIALLREMDEDADVALQANRAYQAELINVMKRLDVARRRTGELSELIRELEAELYTSKDVKVVPAEGLMSEPTLPWFKHFYGKDLPPNPDGEARDRYLSAVRGVPWSTAERAQLKQEIVAQNHRFLAMQAQQRGEDLTEAIVNQDPTWFVENLEGLDWERAALVVDRRTPTEIRIQWTQKDHPLLTPQSIKWSQKEKEKLTEAIEEYGGQDWAGIAKAVGTNRTAADCLRQWRRRPQQKEPLTRAEEDELIKEGVALYGENWQEVARHTSLTSAHCLNRWQRALRPTIKKGRWSAEEDDALRAALASCNGEASWNYIAQRVPGRTDAQCRERWLNCLDPKLKSNKVWNEEEEALLVKLRDVDGLAWSEIASQGFKDTRTDNHCMRHYKLVKARALPGYVPPRKGRPPKKSLKPGHHRKKTEAAKRKEKQLEEEINREVDEIMRAAEEGEVPPEPSRGRRIREAVENEPEEEAGQEGEGQPGEADVEGEGGGVKKRPRRAAPKKGGRKKQKVGHEEPQEEDVANEGEEGEDESMVDASASLAPQPPPRPRGRPRKKKAPTPSSVAELAAPAEQAAAPPGGTPLGPKKRQRRTTFSLEIPVRAKGAKVNGDKKGKGRAVEEG